MKNPKVLLIVIGGVTAVLALVLGYLIWSDSSERAELAETLESATQQADRLARLPIRPDHPKAFADVRSNAQAYVAWRMNALAAIACGDRTFERVTPPAFKTYLVNEARRLSSLPGAASGKLVKPDFAFGFKDYITGGVLPTVADLPRLQREWSDITTVVELLATNGVAEITDVRMAAAAAPAEEEAKPKSKSKKKSKKAKADEETFQPDISRFAVDFLARPEAIVGTVNGAASAARYIVIEDFRFAPEKDALVEELGGEDKSQAAQQATGGRRGRRRASQIEKAKGAGEGEEKKTGAVTDPATAAPLKVTMTFAVYDFRTAGAKPATGEEASK